jgi:hypothetical protein
LSIRNVILSIVDSEEPHNDAALPNTSGVNTIVNCLQFRARGGADVAGLIDASHRAKPETKGGQGESENFL